MDELNKETVGAAINQMVEGDIPDVVSDEQLREFQDRMPSDLVDKKIGDFAADEKRRTKVLEEKEKKLAEKLVDPDDEESEEVELELPTVSESSVPENDRNAPGMVDPDASEVEAREVNEEKSPISGLFEEKRNPFEDLLEDVPILEVPENEVLETINVRPDEPTNNVSDMLDDLIPGNSGEPQLPDQNEEGSLGDLPTGSSDTEAEDITSDLLDDITTGDTALDGDVNLDDLGLDESAGLEKIEPISSENSEDPSNVSESEPALDKSAVEEEGLSKGLAPISLEDLPALDSEKEDLLAGMDLDESEEASIEDDLDLEGSSDMDSDSIEVPSTTEEVGGGFQLETMSEEDSQSLEEMDQSLGEKETLDPSVFEDVSTEQTNELEENIEPDAVDASLGEDGINQSPKVIGEYADAVQASEDIMAGLEGTPISEFRESDENAPDFGNQETLFERAFDQLKTYSEEGRQIIYAAIVDKQLTEEQNEHVFSELINAAPEKVLLQYIYDALVESPTYEQAEDLKALRKRQFRENFIPLIKYSAAGLLLLGLLTTLFIYTKDILLAYHHYAQGIESIEERRYQDSEEHFETAMGLNQDIGEVNRYAQAYIEQKRYYDAEKKYKRALEIDPQHFTTRFNLGKMYVLKEDYTKAEELLTVLERDHPDEEEVSETIGKMYLNWSERNRSKLIQAKKKWDSLYRQDPANPYYLAKKVQLSAMDRDYHGAKAWQKKLNQEQPGYIEPIAHTKLMSLYIDEYERNYVKKGVARSHVKDEQLFLVQQIQEMGKGLLRNHKDYLPMYSTVARWQLATDRPERAAKTVKNGISEYQKTGAGATSNPYELYQLQGMIQHLRGKSIEAMTSFKTALEMNPESPMDAFYVGKITLEELGDMDEALDYFNLAKLHWKDNKKTEYLELLNGLAYTYYHSAVKEDDRSVLTKDKRLEESLSYWTELGRLWDQHYLVSLAKGNTYLRLGQNQLAIAEFENSKENLMPAWKYYVDHSGSVTQEVKSKVSVLGDVYNNLALAQMGASFNRISPLRNKTEALNNIINSIDMKDKIGDVKGTAIANFNRINDSKVRNINQFKVSDEHMPMKLSIEGN